MFSTTKFIGKLLNSVELDPSTEVSQNTSQSPVYNNSPQPQRPPRKSKAAEGSQLLTNPADEVSDDDSIPELESTAEEIPFSDYIPVPPRTPIVQEPEMNVDSPRPTSLYPDLSTINQNDPPIVGESDSPIVSSEDPPIQLIPEGPMIELHAVKAPQDTLLIGVSIPNSPQDSVLTALVDTGAAVSLLASRHYQTLDPSQHPLMPTHYKGVEGIGKTMFPVLGAVTLSLTLSNTFTTSPISFVVIDDRVTNYDIVIGYDLLHKESLLPDLAHKELVIRNKNTVTTVVRDMRSINSQTYRAELDKNVTVAPNMCITVPIRIVDSLITPSSLLLFTPDNRNRFVMDYAVTPVLNSITRLHLYNITEDTLKLKRGYSPGVFAPVMTHTVSLPEINVVELTQQPQITYPEWTQETLIDAFQIDSTDLTRDQKDKLIELLLRYPTVLSLGDADVGCTSVLKHVIDTIIDDPINVPVRRIQGPILYEIEEVCQQLEVDGIIRRSFSPYSAPVVPVRKPDGTLRLCIDYRKLNQITKGDSFPIPNLVDTLFSLQGMKFFSTIDLIKGYYQIEMENDSIEKTAFSTPLSHWEFLRMPFGVKNGPATFQRAMRLALCHIPWYEVMIYLDDVLIISDTFDKHLMILEDVLEAFRVAGFKLKPSKTNLLQRHVKFLGHQISDQGMKPLEKNLQGVKDFPVPKTVRQVRQFMGLVNFYRRHIPHCSEIAKPLFDLLSSKRTINWTDECQHAFDSLKELLTSPPILSYPDRTTTANPLVLHVDASGIGAGACLSQVQDNVDKPIAYISMVFSKAQRRYSTTDREVAAIRWAVQSLKPFLYGIKVVIFTDHKPLLFLQNMSLVNQRVARTLEELNDIDYELRYIPGKDNIVADVLSRVSFDLKLKTSTYTRDLPEVPDGFMETKTPGGGDSLFQCFSYYLHGHFDSHIQIREEVVEELLNNRQKYHLPTGREANQTLKQLQLTKYPGQLPFTHSIEAFANLYLTRILVYYSKDHPLHFGKPSYEDVCCLFCLGGIHFNVLTPIRNIMPETARRALNSDPQKPTSTVLHVLVNDELSEDPETAFTNDHMELSGGEVPHKEISFQTNIISLCNFKLISDPQDSVDVTLTQIVECQMTDTVLKRLRFCLLNNRPFRGPLKQYQHARNSMSILDNQIIHRTRADKYHYVVSFQFAVDVAIINHSEFVHIGQRKLYSLLETIIWHPKLKDICRDITLSCHKCQLAKISNIYHAPPMIKIHTRYPFELVAVDLLQLPKSSKGNNYAMVLIDHYSK